MVACLFGKAPCPRPSARPQRGDDQSHSRAQGTVRQLMAGALRVGLLGGSFNPAHSGHRAISLAAIQALGLDERAAVRWNTRLRRAGRIVIDEVSLMAAFT